MVGLDVPAGADELYLVRGAEVEPYRPVLTGDVFRDTLIPGVSDTPGMALVLAHPCSMRQGAHLRSYVQVAGVQSVAPISVRQWDGNYGVMPLPDLLGAGDATQSAAFELTGRVASTELSADRRLASLSTTGLLFLLQRLAHYWTRVVIDLDTLLESVGHVLEEADLLEEWVRGRWDPSAERGELIRRSELEFDEVMGREVAGMTRRRALRDPKLRAAVRRAVHDELGG